jgi:hypothetical protein
MILSTEITLMIQALIIMMRRKMKMRARVTMTTSMATMVARVTMTTHKRRVMSTHTTMMSIRIHIKIHIIKTMKSIRKIIILKRRTTQMSITKNLNTLRKRKVNSMMMKIHRVSIVKNTQTKKKVRGKVAKMRKIKTRMAMKEVVMAQVVTPSTT